MPDICASDACAFVLQVPVHLCFRCLCIVLQVPVHCASGACPFVCASRACAFVLQMPPAFDFGDVVKASRSDEYGVVRYVGTTQFAAGTWVGLELDNATGKHDGTVSG